MLDKSHFSASVEKQLICHGLISILDKNLRQAIHETTHKKCKGRAYPQHDTVSKWKNYEIPFIKRKG